MSVTDALLAWTFAPSVLLGLALTAMLYVAGLRTLARRGRRVAARPVAFFVLGMLALLLALVSPLDTLDARLFSIHMIQHMVLLMVAPPLLLLGKPIPVLLVGAPHGLVRRVARTRHRTPWLRRLTRLLVTPLVAWPLYMGDIVLWHLPALYGATLRSTGVHLLEHFCFLGTGLLFWWVMIEPLPGPPRLHYGYRLLCVWLAAIPNTALGLFFAVRATPVYQFYTAQPRLWNVSAIDDQRLGGIIMWIMGDATDIVAAVILVVALMTPNKQTLLDDAEEIVRQAQRWYAEQAQQ